MIQVAHRIVLTELCNGTCPHCFNSEFRKTAEMDVDKLVKFWRMNRGPYLADNRLKIMGGEPTMHPRIIEVMQEGCLYFGGVDLFTNGSQMLKIASDPLILRYHLTNVVQYIINGYTFDYDYIKDAIPFLREIVLHFVIPSDVEEMRALCYKIENCMSIPIAHIIISPNTQVNLFDDEIQESYRKVWMEAITRIVPKMISKGIGFDYDHVLPICFYTQEMLDELHYCRYDGNKYLDAIHSVKITCCCEEQMGLILPNFDMYFCNQTRIKLGSILDENGEPRKMEDITEMIQRFSSVKTKAIKELSPKCAKCAVVASCKVGCYYTTLLRETRGIEEGE